MQDKFMHNYKELKIWIKTRELVKEIYLITEKFPQEEKFGLTSQIRRAVISISSNIAEGSGKSSDREFNRYLEIAYSSAFELESQIILSEDLSFISNRVSTEILSQVQQIQKMIYSFSKTIINKRQIN